MPPLPRSLPQTLLPPSPSYAQRAWLKSVRKTEAGRTHPSGSRNLSANLSTVSTEKARASRVNGCLLWPSLRGQETSLSLSLYQNLSTSVHVHRFTVVNFRALTSISELGDNLLLSDLLTVTTQPTIQSTMSASSSKGTKKSGKPSTTSQGKKSNPKKLEREFVDLDKEHDSSDCYIEDEFDAWEPPRTRGDKGGRHSRRNNQKAQETNAPETRSKSKLSAVKIKTEPVSPQKQEETAPARGATGTSSKAVVPTTSGESFANPAIFPAINEKFYSPDAVTTPDDQLVTKPGTESKEWTPAQHRQLDQLVEDKLKAIREQCGDEDTVTAGEELGANDPQSPPKRPKMTSTPVKASSSLSTPVKVSPRRSPRTKKETKTSPGKKIIENHISQYTGLARKKKASQKAITEESESDEDSVNASSETVVNNIGEESAKPFYRAPYPPGYGEHSKREQLLYPPCSPLIQKIEAAGQTSAMRVDCQICKYPSRESNQENVMPHNCISHDGSLGMDSGFGQGEYSQDQSHPGETNPETRPVPLSAFPGNHLPIFANTSSVVVGDEGAATGVAGSSVVPQPPPPPPPALPIPSAIRLATGGPAGLESPSSSNVTEVLSPTVKGPFEDPQVEDERAMRFFEDGDKKMTTPPPSPAGASGDEAMEQDFQELDAMVGHQQLQPSQEEQQRDFPVAVVHPKEADSNAAAIFNPDILATGTNSGLDAQMAAVDEDAEGSTNQAGLQAAGLQTHQAVNPSAPVVVTETINACQQRSTAVIQDPTTGQAQVIGQIEQSVIASNVSRNEQGQIENQSLLAGQAKIVTYPPQYLPTHQQPQFPHNQTHIQPHAQPHIQPHTQPYIQPHAQPNHQPDYQHHPQFSQPPPTFASNPGQFLAQPPPPPPPPPAQEPNSHPQFLSQENFPPLQHNPTQFQQPPPQAQPFIQPPQQFQNLPPHHSQHHIQPPPSIPVSIPYPPPNQSANTHKILHLTNVTPPEQASRLCKIDTALLEEGAWADDAAASSAAAGLAATTHQTPQTAPGDTPAAPDVQMDGDEEEEDANKTIDASAEAAKAKETNSEKTTAVDESAAAAPKKLVTVPPGQRPPPERDPKDPKYDFRGLEQKDLDANAMKIWHQEDRLRDFEVIFGTRDPVNNPTNATEEFYAETGYRRELSPNHIMAALRNSSFAKVADMVLETARVEGPEQDGARLLLLQAAIDNLMVPKMQKKKGLRNARGRKRTPEEAEQVLKVRAIQEQLAASRREAKAAKQTTQPTQPDPNSSSKTAKPPKDSSTSQRPLARPPSNSRDQTTPTAKDGGSKAREAQPGPSRSSDRSSSRGRGRGRGRDRSSSQSGRHNTPASDKLGRSAKTHQQQQQQQRQGKGKQNNSSNNKNVQNSTSSNATAQVSTTPGSSHGSSAVATASASASSRSTRASESSTDPQRRTSTRDSETSADLSQNLSQNSVSSQNTNAITDRAAPPVQAPKGAGVSGPQSPIEAEAEELRLVVSGKIDDLARMDIDKGEAEARLIPWIGREVMATQVGTAADQVGLRDICFAAKRIIIHPNSQEGGEKIADIIRTRMESDNHPKGFDCEWNGNLDPVAELTIKTQKQGLETEAQVRELIEGENGGLVNLNISLCGWPAHLRGGARLLRFWEDTATGYRIIHIDATKGVIEAIMGNPHQGKVFIGYMMGTVRHERLDVVPGAQINYRRQFSNFSREKE